MVELHGIRKKLLREVLVLDAKTNVLILSIQPFSQDGYEYAVKVRTMNVQDHDNLQRMVIIRLENIMHAGNA